MVGEVLGRSAHGQTRLSLDAPRLPLCALPVHQLHQQPRLRLGPDLREVLRHPPRRCTPADLLTTTAADVRARKTGTASPNVVALDRTVAAAPREHRRRVAPGSRDGSEASRPLPSLHRARGVMHDCRPLVAHRVEDAHSLEARCSQAGILAHVLTYAARRHALVRVELQGCPRLVATGLMQDRPSSP